MELSEAQWDRLDRYLMGRLTPEEVASLEEELAQSSELREALALQKRIQAGAVLLGQEQLKKKLTAIQQEVIGSATEAEPSQASIRKFPLRNWGYVAIAAAIVLLLAIWLGNQNRSTASSPQELFAEKIGEEELDNFRSKGPDQQDSLLNQAKKLAESEEWLAAAQSFSQFILQDSSGTGGLHLSAGFCYLKADAYTEAIQVLEPIRESPLLFDQSLWLTALGYLGRNQGSDLESCRATLQALIARLSAITNPPAVLQKAEDLLQELESLEG